MITSPKTVARSIRDKSNVSATLVLAMFALYLIYSVSVCGKVIIFLVLFLCLMSHNADVCVVCTDVKL